MKFNRLQLDNRVTLYHMYLPNAETVAAGVLVKAGTCHEIWPKEAGIAHALEHMRFQGTEDFPTSQEVSAYIEDVGGVINAWTSGEGTFFWQKVPAYEFERMPRMLYQQAFRPLIREDKITTEMQNIVQEIRRSRDNPHSFALREFEHLVYKGHVLERDVLGTEGSVTSFTRNDFLNFSERLYSTGRLAIVVVGNVAEEEALEAFNNYFKENKNIGSPNQPSAQPVGGKKEKIYKKQIEQVHMVLGYLLGSGNDSSTDALDMFSNMLRGGMSFPLFQIVRDQHGLCYEINCDVDQNSKHSLFCIYVGTDPKKYTKAEDLILKVIEENKNNRRLLERAKTLSLGRLSMLYENPASILRRAALEILYRTEPRSKEEEINAIKSISIEEIEEAVNIHLKQESLNKVIVGPESL